MPRDLSPCPYTREQLAQAAAELDRNRLTRAGRALQKHANRPGTTFSLPPQRTASAYNRAGQAIVEAILDDPGITVTMLYKTRLGVVYTIRSASGWAVRFDSAGKMVGLREP